MEFKPIVEQTGTVTYDTAENTTEVTEKYIKPPACNEYKISNCLKFTNMLNALLSLLNDEEYVLYDLESLFTSIPLK